jgi:cytochrome P450
MVLYPEVQKLAQAEIDTLVGQDRFPTFKDRDNLPYIGALIQELLRWAPVAPQGQLQDLFVLDPIYSATQGSRTTQ